MSEEEIKQKIKEADDNVALFGAQLKYWRAIKRENENLLRFQSSRGVEGGLANSANIKFRGGRVPLWFKAAELLREHGQLHADELLLLLEQSGTRTTKQSLVGILLQESQRRKTFNTLGKNNFSYNEESNLLGNIIRE